MTISLSTFNENPATVQSCTDMLGCKTLSSPAVVALTPELESYTRALRKKLKLTFDILTDLYLNTAEQFRLVYALPDYLRDLYKSFGSALDRFHEETEYRLPIPARYVIDKEWIIRAAEVNADYAIHLEPSETVRLLRTLSTRRHNSVDGLEKD